MNLIRKVSALVLYMTGSAIASKRRNPNTPHKELGRDRKEATPIPAVWGQMPPPPPSSISKRRNFDHYEFTLDR